MTATPITTPSLPPPPIEQPDLLSPGESRFEVKPVAAGIEVLFSGWLACDGQFELRTNRQGLQIHVQVSDMNSSTQRLSCVGQTDLRTEVRDLDAGTYTVVFDPGRGHTRLRDTVTVP